MSNTTYPSGQVLTSTAITPAAISTLLQSLTYGAIGLTVPPPGTFQPVQVNWQTQGQPFNQLPSQDVCYVACVPTDVEYSRIRDSAYNGNANPVTQTWNYTRGWRVSWVLYGSNASDRARMLKSAVFMDFFNDGLNFANLYPLPDMPEPTRMPELINAEWWERADFHLDMYEAVTEAITYGRATSLEIKVLDSAGTVSDTTVNA